MLRDVRIRLQLDVSDYRAKAAWVASQTKQMGADLKRSAREQGEWFDKNQQSLDKLAGASLKLGAGIVGVGVFAGKSAMDWQQSWTGVLKTVDGTDEQLSTLEASLRDLPGATGFAHDEIAGVAEAAGQLGISTPSVSAFTKTMLDMGVSTNLGAEEAATGLARFRNIMGSSEAEVSNMGSTIVGLGNNFATTEREILDMSMRLAGAGRQAGMSEADVMGLAAAMSSVGIEAEAGGTSMSLVMKRIGREVDTNGKKLETFARIADMPVEKFKKEWKKDAGSALAEFVKGLNNASNKGESLTLILDELGIKGQRESDAVLRLAGNHQGLAEALGMANKEWDKNNALTAEADKFYNTSPQKAKRAWGDIKDAAIDVGADLLPVVADLAEGVSDLANAFSELPDPVKGGLGKLALVGGGTLLAIGGITKTVGAVRDLNAALGGAGLSKKAMLARAGVGALGLGLLSLASNMDTDVPDGVEAMTTALGGAMAGFAVGGPWGMAIGAAGGAVAGFASEHKKAKQEIEGMTEAIKASGTVMDERVRKAAADRLAKPMQKAPTPWGEDSMSTLEAAEKLGIESKKVVDASLGNSRALKEIRARVAELRAMDAYELEDEAKRLGMSYGDMFEIMKLFGKKVDEESVKWGKANEEFHVHDRAMKGLISTKKEFAEATKEIPKEVITQIEMRGYDVTEEQIGILAEKYALTPEHVATLLSAVDRATPLIEDVAKDLKNLDAENAKPTISIEDKATATINRIGSLIRGLPGGADIPIGESTKKADGGIIARANGGMDVHGRRVPRIPQMRSGQQGTVMWGEPETGWEAYISGKPGMEARNQAIWMAAGKKLGMLDDAVTAFASGGMTASSDAEYLRLKQSVASLKKDLAKKNKKGKYKVRGLDRSIMQAELREAQAELAEQKRIRSQIGKGRAYASVGAFNEAQGFRDSAFAIEKFTSAAGIESRLQRRIGEMAEFTQILAQLKARGASPWLLNEFVREVNSRGPSRALNRAARQYLTDHQALLRVNALASQANMVSAAFGQLTTATTFNQAQAANVLSTSQMNQLSQITAAVQAGLSRATVSAKIDPASTQQLASQIASTTVTATRSTFDQKTFAASTPSSAMSGGLS